MVPLLPSSTGEPTMIALSAVRPGSAVRIRKLEGQPELCLRLREMGFCEDSVIRCLQASPSCVCLIQHSRVGLSSQIARQILVEPV
ncbi:MAG: ferrous iron transport protein A [Armatimonadota bacterium]